MDLLKLIAMSQVVRINPATGPLWKKKANARAGEEEIPPGTC
jgi:hypothetical protein